MTGPSRTDELIRAMLERRSDAPVPPWLADRTMHAVTAAGQVRRGWRSRVVLPERTAVRFALVGAAVVGLLALTGGALLAAGIIDLPGTPPPSAPAIVVGPEGSPTSPAASDDGSAAAPTEAPSLAPPPTARPVPDALEPDTLAVVTKAGKSLRVRSAPGVGDDSKRLEPTLKTGTRMLVVGGPEPADGYDWYEVLVDPDQENLYGWVAANGKDGKAWIKPKAPSCPDELSDRDVVTLNPIDWLVCYGDSEVELLVNRVEAEQGDDSPCMRVGLDVCTVEPAWMNAPVWMDVDLGAGDSAGLMTVAAPDTWSQAAAVPQYTPALVTIAADQPDARECRFTDSAGNDLVPPARAVLACRLQFVLLNLETLAPEPSEPSSDIVPDTMAVPNVDVLDVWSQPGDEPGAAVLYSVNRDAMLYVDDGPSDIGGERWYAVLPEDPAIGRYGWVHGDIDGTPTLQPAPVDCPSPTDWAAFNQLSTVRRLVCSDGTPVSVLVVIDAWREAQPTSSFACMAFPYVVGRPPCEATPAWLASPTGIDATGPGPISFPAVDPDEMSQDELPSDPTVMRVTGRYEHPASGDCRVTNPATGEELMDPAEAAIYCRARFVIASAEPVN